MTRETEFTALHNELVPQSGMAETTRGELLRSVANVLHDVRNNGGCNLEHYRYELEVIAKWFPKADIKVLRRHAIRLANGHGMYIRDIVAEEQIEMLEQLADDTVERIHKGKLP